MTTYRSHIIAATGHRPDKLGGYSREAEQRLLRAASVALRFERPTQVISGLALGWDTAIALAALEERIPLICAIPFPEQASRWPTPSFERWCYIKQQAREVHTIAPEFSLAAFQTRNEWMVNNYDLVLAFWNGSAGGTANCIRYAKQQGKSVFNCWNVFKGHL